MSGCTEQHISEVGQPQSALRCRTMKPALLARATGCGVLIAALVSCSSISPSSIGPRSERLQSCDAQVAVKAAKEILNDAATLKEPAAMFASVLTLYRAGDREEAVFWYYAAYIRTQYQAISDADVARKLKFLPQTTGAPILNHAYQDISRLNSILDQVEAWDKANPNPLSDQLRSALDLKRVAEIYEQFRTYRARLNADRDDVQARARADAAWLEGQWNEVFTSSGCPSAVSITEAERAKEIERVVPFVTSHPDVLPMTGGNKWTGPFPGYSTWGSDPTPYRYEVGLSSLAGKSLWAIVDVTRERGEPAKFTLRCVTQISLGGRTNTRDPCAPQ